MDQDSVRRYEEWFASRPGAFAFARERSLLERLIAGWPRRGQKLLEIGCGPGLFLEAFWEAGFEVSGLDKDPYMLRRARERLGGRADLHLGDAAHLPFDDNEFDFAALVTVVEFAPEPGRVILEAARVAQKGLLIGFLNRHSLYYLEKGRPWPWARRGRLRRAHWYAPGEMRRLAAACLGPRPTAGGSVLAGPTCTWRNALPCRWLNCAVPFGLGGFAALRVDLYGDRPLTPIISFATKPQMG
ncbi:MAG: class I SAM-dependent methyltransferase [Thermodesulfobacteriota bacterium]